jgi:PilZ domain
MPVRIPSTGVAKKKRASTRFNRRFGVRYPSGVATANGPDAQDGLLFRQAPVHDISHRGIALILPQPLAPGEDLCIQVTNRILRFSYDLNVQVRHASPHGHGRWIVGFAFPRALTLAELASLL